MTTTTPSGAPSGSAANGSDLHGGLTCTEIEDSHRRGWAKVETLAVRVRSLEALVESERAARLTAQAERDGAEQQVALLTEEIDAVPDGVALAAADPATADAAWRTATGHARGPIPAAWTDHLRTDAVQQRLTRAMTAAAAAELAAVAADWAQRA